MHQGPRNQRPLGFPGRHLRNGAIGEMRNAKPFQSLLGPREMLRIGMMVRKMRVLLKKPERTTSRPVNP